MSDYFDDDEISARLAEQLAEIEAGRKESERLARENMDPDWKPKVPNPLWGFAGRFVFWSGSVLIAVLAQYYVSIAFQAPATVAPAVELQENFKYEPKEGFGISSDLPKAVDKGEIILSAGMPMVTWWGKTGNYLNYGEGTVVFDFPSDAAPAGQVLQWNGKNLEWHALELRRDKDFVGMYVDGNHVGGNDGQDKN